MKITVQLTIAIFLISLLSLGAVGAISYYEAQEALIQQITNQLESVATIQKSRIIAIINQNLERLSLAASRTQLRLSLEQYNQTPTEELRAEMNRSLKDALASIGDFKNISILNREGEVIASTVPTKIGQTHSEEEYFTQGLKENNAEILFFDENHELSIYLAGPLYREGQFLGVMVIEAKADNLVASVNDYTGLGETGETVFARRDSNGDALFLTPLRFDPNAALTRRVPKDHLDVPITQALLKSEAYFGDTIDYLDVPVLSVTRYIPQADWGLASKIYKEEALRPIVDLRNFLITGTVGISLVVALIAVLIARTITGPIISLTQTAQKISAGDISQRAAVRSTNEIGTLAQTFNQMTEQLQETLGTLEQQVAARTRRLEIVASLSERLSAILKVDDLLLELVEQVKSSFGYYHAHVYLLDNIHQSLVMTAGAGEVGAQMKATGHQIPLNAPTSLVARAARSGQIVRVDNVRLAPDWLPNPLLPNTYAEMAVPILLEGQVVGVLDVQEEKIAGLDEGDANLLRSLANQVAVAIRNARLFAEVESALAEARAAQERYLEQAWEKTKAIRLGAQYHHARPDAPPLAGETLTAARALALTASAPSVVNGEKLQTATIVSPITFQDKLIGTLRLHGNGQPWSDDDLAVVEAVIDQLGQAAENRRLFEETRERARFESTVGEITQKLRQSPTLAALAATAAEELGRRLGVSYSRVKIGPTTTATNEVNES